MQLNTKNLQDVDISRPVIEDGLYHVRLAAEIKDNKSKTGKNLVLTHEVLDVCNHRDTGEEVNKAVRIIRYLSLVPTENYDPDESLKKLATALEIEDGANLELEDVQSAVVKAQIVYKPAEGDFQEGNDVKYWAAKDSDFVDPQM